MNELNQYDIDALLQDAGREKSPEGFADQVMDRIGTLPGYGTSVTPGIPVWFKIFMTTIFTGTILTAIILDGGSQGSGGTFVQWYSAFFRETGAFISGLHLQLFDTVWIFPVLVFILAGILAIFSIPLPGTRKLLPEGKNYSGG